VVRYVWDDVRIGALAGLLACATRTEQTTKAAWDRAIHGPEARRNGRSNPSDSADPLAHDDPWTRIGVMLSEAAAVVADGGDVAAVEGLAKRWCAFEPARKESPYGNVRVCVPDPPITVGGGTFTIELGDMGVVGLAAMELSDRDSTELLRRALEAARRWCLGPLRPAPQREEHRQDEFHMCPVAEGPLLAIGRFPRDLDADLWQVSLTVLGPT